MKQEQYLRMAKQVSKKSDHHSHKMGCVIVKGNKVLGTGFNAMKTHPKSPHTYKNIHAEFMATLNARPASIDGATAYVFREQKNGTWAVAKPCKDCRKFLMDSGIRKVVYSFEGSFQQEDLNG